MIELRSIRTGAAAAALLAAFYAAVVGGASGSWTHLADQARSDWYLVAPLVAGFGIQVTLLTELRRRHRLRAEAMVAGGAGTGASAAGMVACCAHHLADLVPFAGATGMATFLTTWQVPFMVFGLAVNAAAIAIAARRLHQTPNGRYAGVLA